MYGFKFWIESRGVSWLVIVKKRFGNHDQKLYFSSKRNIKFYSTKICKYVLRKQKMAVNWPWFLRHVEVSK
jgi:hypothetical protein